MKSARILIIASVGLLFGYGLIVTLNAWGQDNYRVDPSGSKQLGRFGLDAPMDPDTEMNKLLQEEAAAEQQVAKLVEAYSHAEGESARSGIKSNLSSTLEKEFDLQQKRRDLELKRVEERLRNVRELMKKRNDARRSIIDNRLDQLLREADGLGWTPPAGMNLHRPGYGSSMMPKGPQVK
jgi:hypothetical protein